MNAKQLISQLSIADGRILVSRCKGKILDEVMQRTTFLDESYTLKDRIECIRNNIKSAPICKTCGKPVSWYTSESIFPSYCSNKCHKNSMEFKTIISSIDWSRKPSTLIGLSKEELLHKLTRNDGVVTTGRGIYDADIMNLTDDIHSDYTISDRVKILQLDVSPPICKKCGNIVHWRDGANLAEGFPSYCSMKCQTTDKNLNAIRRDKRMENISEIMEKMQATCMERYGVPNPMQSRIIRQRLKDSCGGFIGAANPIIKNKMNNTMMERYGTIRHVPYRITKPHKMMEDMLVGMKINFISNNRTILGNKELDIYLPDHKLAIEINGLYWHSEKTNTPPMQHVDKLNACISQGIELIQFWDFEVLNKFDLVNSMIASKLGKTDRIFARKCSVIDVSPKDVFDWYEQTHIQGGIRRAGKGLIYNNELVAVMVIRHGVLERFSAKLNTTVVGGMSKLISAFGVSELITYSDDRYTSAASYKKLGFKLIRFTKEPKYYYTSDFKSLVPRWAMMRDKMAKMAGFDFNPELTEWENARNNGFWRVWGCCGKTWGLNVD